MEEDGRSWKKMEEDGRRWKKMMEISRKTSRFFFLDVGDVLETLMGVPIAQKKNIIVTRLRKKILRIAW